MLRYKLSHRLLGAALLVLIAGLGMGAFGRGGGCIGTQSQVRMIGGSSGAFRILSPGVPLTDTGTTTTNLTPTFSWTLFPLDMTSYTLQISTVPDFLGTPTFQNTNISRNASAYQIGPGILASNTTYYWRIIAVDRDTGTSTIASNSPFKFDTGIIPGTFNLISPLGPTINTITPTLVWSVSSRALSYYIQIDTEQTFAIPHNYSVTLSGVTTLQVPTRPVGQPQILEAGQTYFWRVTAIGSGANTTLSTPPLASFAVLGPPGTFLLTSPTVGSIEETLTPTFVWGGASGATSYKIEISESATFSTLFYEWPGIVATNYLMPVGILSHNKTYYWRVLAFNSVATTDATAIKAVNSPFNFRTDVAPKLFTLSTPASNSTVNTLAPSFSWTVSRLATQYTLEITSATTPTATGTWSGATTFIDITSTSYIVPPGTLVDNQRYWWRVLAVNSDGTRLASNSAFSLIPDVKPRSFTLSSPFTGFTVDTLTPAFSWTASTFADNYTMEISTPSNAFTSTDTVITFTGITTTQWTMPSSLVDNTVYYWRVTALSTQTTRTTLASNQPFSLSTDVKPRAFSLTTPVSGSVQTTLQPTLIWGVSTLATSYTVEVSTSTNFTVPLLRAVGVTSTDYTVSGVLEHGGSYYWQVTAISTQTARTTLASNAPFVFSVNVAPGSFTLSNPISGITLSTVTPVFSWTVSARATSYTLQIALTNTFTTTDVVYENTTLTETSFALPAGILANNTSRWWRVRAYNVVVPAPTDALPFIFSVDVTPKSFLLSSPISTTPPQTVPNLTPTLQWTSSLLATTYYLQIDTEEDFTPPYIHTDNNITATSFTVPSDVLIMDTLYWWRVYAVNEYSSPVTATGAPFRFIPRSAPLGFSLLSPDNTESPPLNTLTPTLTWTSALYVATYTLQIATTPTFSPMVYTNTNIAGSVTAFGVPESANLQTAQTYYWRIIASNSVGDTTASNAPYRFSTSVPPAAFELTTPVNGVTVYTLRPTLSWTASRIQSGYTLEIDDEPTFDTLVYSDATIPAVAISTTVPGGVLVGNTVYYWRIIARNASGNRTAGNAPFRLQTGAAPGTFFLTSPLNDSLTTTTPTLLWSASANATGYTVQVSSDPNFTSPEYVVAGITLTSHTVVASGLIAEVTYYWRVIAGNDFGSRNAANSGWSFETWDNTIPALFSMLSPPNPSTLSSYTPVLGWENAAGENIYIIEVATDTLFTTNLVYTNTAVARNSTSFTLPIDALPVTGTTYYWRVIARNSAGDRIGVGAPFEIRVDATTSPWKPLGSSSAYTFQARRGHSAVWTGADMLIWGGIGLSGTSTTYFADGIGYNREGNYWYYLSGESAPSARSGHTAIWTGTYMVIWGGTNGTSYFNDGARYNPADNTWIAMSAAPISARANHTAVWTGSQILFWGGRDATQRYNNGARYNPADDTWSSISSDSAPTVRGRHSAIWDPATNRMFIWGGYDGSNVLNSGGIYSSSSNTWLPITATANRPIARANHTAIWSDSQMFIYGGDNTQGTSYPLAVLDNISTLDGRYSPADDTWTRFPLLDYPGARTNHTAVWTGSQMVIWGGFDGTNRLNTGARYTALGNNWTTMSISSAPTGREQHTAVWTGSEMLVWGGWNGENYFNTGSIYNLILNQWTSLPLPTIITTLPSGRQGHSAVFTRNGIRDEVIIWGGWNGTTALRDGARYNPVNNNWDQVTALGAPTTRQGHTAVWTDLIGAGLTRRMLIWGGGITPPYTNTGAEYYQTSTGAGRWSSLPTAGLTLSPRTGHSACWAYEPDYGSGDRNEMIIWGGYDNSTYFNNGQRYNLRANIWVGMADSGAPSGRRNHSALWTGSQMLIWGGIISDTIRTNSGGRYTPAGNSWDAIAEPSIISRQGHAAVWTGTNMLIWGGVDGTTYLNDGAVYTPTSNTWNVMTTTNAPSVRANAQAVWGEYVDSGGITRTGLFVWGGENGVNSYLNTGAIYDPTSDTWTTLSTTGAPTARAYHSALWLDFITLPSAGNRRVRELLIWGGAITDDFTNSGSRYKPQ
ncbi:MAG: hypothetical protein QME51_02885 [Planctomycetota bacterium]|nr:hypothetical protein [Planctomycetota bacterium]